MAKLIVIGKFVYETPLDQIKELSLDLTNKIKNTLEGKNFISLYKKEASIFRPSYSVSIFAKGGFGYDHKLLIKCKVPIKVIAPEKDSDDLVDDISGEDVNYFLFDEKIDAITVMKKDKDTSKWYDKGSPLCGMFIANIGQRRLTIWPNKLEHGMSTGELDVIQDSIPLELSLAKDIGF